MTALAYDSPAFTTVDEVMAIDYTNDLTVELDTCRIERRGGYSTLRVDLKDSSFAVAMALRGGDSISGTVHFSNGPILLQGSSRRRAVYTTLNFDQVGASDRPLFMSEDSLSLLGFAGTMPVSDPSRLAVIGGDGLSVGLVESGSPYALSFTGFRYKIRITGVFGGDSAEEALVALASLRFQADTISLGSAQPRPAPLKWFERLGQRARL